MRLRAFSSLLIALLSVGSSARAQHDPEAALTQAVDQFGVHLEYPAGWTVVASEQSGAILVFPETHPPVNGGKWFTHGFAVETFPPQKYTIEDYNLVLSGDARRIVHKIFDKMNDGDQNAKIVAEQSTKIAGVEGYAITYEMTPPLKLMMSVRKELGLLLVPKPKRGETARCFHLFTPETEWENYKPILFAMLNRVRVEEHRSVQQEDKTGSDKISTETAPTIQRILERFKQGKITIPSSSIQIDTSPEGTSAVNGSAHRNSNQIVLTRGAIRQLPEDELAFLIAHEMGHLMDMSDACENSESHEQHQCEDTADFTAEQIMLGSGYSGYAGAGLMGRFMMMGDRASFTNQLFTTLFDSHRSEVGRTNNLLAAWRAYCKRFGCS